MLQRRALLVCVLPLAVGCSDNKDEGTSAPPAVSQIPAAWAGFWDAEEVVVNCPWGNELDSFPWTWLACAGQDFEVVFWNGRAPISRVCAGAMTDASMDLSCDFRAPLYIVTGDGEETTTTGRYRAFVRAQRNGESAEMWVQMQIHFTLTFDGRQFDFYFCDELFDTMTWAQEATPEACAARQAISDPGAAQPQSAIGARPELATRVLDLAAPEPAARP